MPDGAWEELSGGTQQAWEAQYQDPDASFTAPHRQDRSDETEADGTRVTTITDTYATVNVQGHEYGGEVIHKCNRCDDGHIDTLRALDGWSMAVPYTPLHVPANRYGQGQGILYSSVKVTGHLLRRVETRIRAAHAAAPRVEVLWERKELDHVEQRDLIVLEEFASIVDCTLGVEESSISYHMPAVEMFALALARVPILADDVGWVDEGEVRSHLAEALGGADRPAFRFVGGTGAAEMILEQRSDKKSVELGRVKLEVSHDGKRVVAKRYEPTRSEG